MGLDGGPGNRRPVWIPRVLGHRDHPQPVFAWSRLLEPAQRLRVVDELFSLHANGLFLRREALDAGYSDRDLLHAVRAGVLIRVRHGAYVGAHTWQQRDDVGRHGLRCQAVTLTHGHEVALSHTSGAAVMGLRIWGADLSKVHVTRLDELPGNQSRDVVYHRGHWDADDIHQVGEMLVMSPARCALGTAALSSVESGLVTLDSAYDLGYATETEMQREYVKMSGWPGTARLQVTLRLAEPGAESVGESRNRYMFWSQHLPKPVLQFEVYDHDGSLVGVSDFAWPDHGLLGEFDGRVKYGRYLRPGESVSDAVYREKLREDLLRELTGWSMIRFIWSDLDRPAATTARVRRMLSRTRFVA